MLYKRIPWIALLFSLIAVVIAGMALRQTPSLPTRTSAVHVPTPSFGQSAVVQPQDPAQLSNVRAALLEHPEIIVEALHAYEARKVIASRQNSIAAVSANEKELLDDKGAVLGNPDGRNVLVVFTSFACGYCRNLYPDLLKLLESDRNVKVVVKEYPVFGPGSMLAAKASIAAGHQGRYPQMYDALMRMTQPFTKEMVRDAAVKMGLNTDLMFKDMETDETQAIIQVNLTLGQRVGISGTPSLIRQGSAVLTGAESYQTLAAFVQGNVAPASQNN